MRNLKDLFRWFYDRIRNYNLFMLEENEYDDDDDNEQKDSAVVFKQQNYTTWFYVLLLMVSLYILFYTAWMKPHPRKITVSNISSTLFNELYREHAETLLCPCSRITVPLKTFVSNTIKFHPVCSSIFISQEWIKALYFKDASRYGTGDFRTTASSQFQLLAALCSLSQDITNQHQDDLDNNDFINNYLFPEIQVQHKVNAIVEFFNSRASTQIMSFLNYLRATIQANFVVSALNTNFLITFQSNSIREPVMHPGEIKYTKITVGDSSKKEHIGCSNTNPTTAAGFLNISNDPRYRPRSEWSKPGPDNPLVSGFFTGCTPLEAILQSSLDCLYIIECLQLLKDKFPDIKSMDLNLTDSVLSSKQQKMSVNNHLVNLFIEEWPTKMNYSQYFAECASSRCTYDTADQTNFSDAITLLISLYGGLIIILRLITPFLLKFLLKLKCHPRNTNAVYVSLTACIRQFGPFLKRLNLFKKSDERTENNIKQQKIITRVYLVLLTGAFLILVLFTSLRTEAVTQTVSKPPLAKYNGLQDKYSKTLRCPCSNMIIPYERFITVSPILHQVCSSDLVTDEWISILENIKPGYKAPDWRDRAFSQFHLLSNLCKLARTTIDDAVQRFLLQSFIASNVVPKINFDNQFKAILDQFFQSTIASFDLLIETTRILIQIDQPYLGIRRMRTEQENPAPIFSNNTANGQTTVQVVFRLAGPPHAKPIAYGCICATDIHCRSKLHIHYIHSGLTDSPYYTKLYTMPDLFGDCSATDSLMLSTLECYYSNSDCLSTVMHHSKEIYFRNVEHPLWFDARPLVYNSTLSSFPPNTSISTIVKNLTIERWNSSFSYERFYNSCAPSHCIYSERIRSKTIVDVMITLVSLIGGLIMSLRIITPLLVKFFFWLFTKTDKKPDEQQEVQPKGFDRVKAIIKKIFTLVYTILVDLNIFMIRDFGSNVDRITAKRLGQWATRLYVVLFVVGLVILAVYNATKPTTETKPFDTPSLHYYNQLFQEYGDKLKCTCSLITSKYDQFVTMEAEFHEVCSSPFASDEGRISLTANLSRGLYIYAQTDYRRFLSAHLQFLQGLCQLSNQTVTISIQQFLSSLFATAELLSETKFDEDLNLIIKQRKSNISRTFTRLLFLVRNINHANGLISNYETNFKYIVPWSYIPNTYAPIQAMVYDDNCSCGSYPNCTTQANFIETDPKETISIKGMKMGCTPSESFRASTLECFYDQSCVDLILQYTKNTNRINSINSLNALSTTNSRFLINITIAELINHLFIEKWNTSSDYSLYFEQCKPLLCSYEYIQQFNIFDTVIVLIGLQGGLAIILQWICPKIIRILVKVYQYRKKRINTIQPVSSIETVPIEHVNTNIDNSTSDVELIPTNVTYQTNSVSPVRCSFKTILICILLLCITAGLILFSIHIAQQAKNQVVLTPVTTTRTRTDSTTSTIKSSITTMVMTTTTTTRSGCQLKFQPITAFKDRSSIIREHVIADFNGDDKLDLAFPSTITSTVNVLFGNGHGSFGLKKTSHNSLFQFPVKISVGDFNNDNKLDLVVAADTWEQLNPVFAVVIVMLGNGDGTFKERSEVEKKAKHRLPAIAVTDFNGDRCSDIVITFATYSYITVFLGNCDGTFKSGSSWSTGVDSYSVDIAVTDFNRDGSQDIAVVNYRSQNIRIFLGDGNGHFEKQKTSSTGGSHNPFYLAVGDFNGDTLPDVAVSYQDRNYINIMFGVGDGTLGNITKFGIGDTSINHPIVVSDFNGDHVLDIGFGQANRRINVLVGYGNGNFEQQSAISVRSYIEHAWVDVGDFNGDGYADIIHVDSINSTYDIF